MQLGLPVTSNSVISGDEMDRWNDHLLEEMIDNITIFYRMAPKHKVKIIKVGLTTGVGRGRHRMRSFACISRTIYRHIFGRSPYLVDICTCSDRASLAAYIHQRRATSENIQGGTQRMLWFYMHVAQLKKNT